MDQKPVILHPNMLGDMGYYSAKKSEVEVLAEENLVNMTEAALKLPPGVTSEITMGALRKKVVSGLVSRIPGAVSTDVMVPREIGRRLQKEAKKAGVEPGEFASTIMASTATGLPSSFLKKAEEVRVRKEIAERELELALLNKEEAELRVHKTELEARVKEAEVLSEVFKDRIERDRPERIAVLLNKEDGKIYGTVVNKQVIVFAEFGPGDDLDEIIAETKELFEPSRGKLVEVTHDQLREILLADDSWDKIMLSESYLVPDDFFYQSRELFEASGLWTPNLIRMGQDLLRKPEKAPKFWYALGPYDDGEGIRKFNSGDSSSLYVIEHDGKRVIPLYADKAVGLRIQTVDDGTSLYEIEVGRVGALFEDLAKNPDNPTHAGFVVSGFHVDELDKWCDAGDLPDGDVVPFENDLFDDLVIMQVEISGAVKALEEARKTLARQKEERLLAEWQGNAAKTWNAMAKLSPWARALFPFYLDLKPLGIEEVGRVRVEVFQESRREAMSLGVRVEFQDLTDAAYGYQIEAWEAQSNRGVLLTAGVRFKDLATEDIQARGDRRWLTVLTCAFAAITDLLTREIKLVERKKAVDKRIVAHKGLPGIRIDYNPILYAPRVKRVQVGDGNIQRRMEERERERQEQEQRDREEAERLARQKVKHRVASFRRNLPPGRTMSLKQRKRLLELEANNVIPVDAMGNVIPAPGPSDNYTIVLEHERGNLDPEVVSKHVLDLIEQYRKGK